MSDVQVTDRGILMSVVHTAESVSEHELRTIQARLKAGVVLEAREATVLDALISHAVKHHLNYVRGIPQ